MKKVLVIVAHPDDEVLGCGGTLLTHYQNGDQIYVLICCECKSLRKQPEQQDGNLHRAMEKLHVSKLFRLNMPSQRLDESSLFSLVQPIENVMEEVGPHIIYTHFRGDNNQDHRRVFEATMIAARPIREELEAVYAFYTASSTEWGRTTTFAPDTWVDISHVIEEKLEAFACHQSEVRPYPHPRSIEALRNVAKFWGNQCLMEYAESFQTVMRLVRGERQEEIA